MVEVLICQRYENCYTNTTPDHLRFLLSIAEHAKQRINEDGYQNKIPNIKCHRLDARHYRRYKLIGEIRQRQSVLVECHPEEEHYGEYEAQCHDTFFRLLRREFLYFLTACSCLFGGVLYVLEPRTASVINSDTEYQRSAGYSESKVVTVVHACAQTLLCPSHDLHGRRRCEHGTDVDRHVEQRESGVAAVRIGGIVIEVADHHLQIALEKTRTETDEHQSSDHACHRYCGTAVLHAAHRNRQEHVS